MSIKDDFVARLNPLLIAAEQAIKAQDKDKARRLSVEILALVRSFSHRLEVTEMRECLNNPVANAIAERLKVLLVN